MGLNLKMSITSITNYLSGIGQTGAIIIRVSTGLTDVGGAVARKDLGTANVRVFWKYY